MAIRGFEIYLDDVTSYPGMAQVDLPFYANAMSIVSDHPTAVIYASLSGNTDDASVNGARTAASCFRPPSIVSGCVVRTWLSIRQPFWCEWLRSITITEAA